MPKSLYSSRECPDSMADRLAAHRFGVFACTVLTVFGSLWISNAMSVREEERVLRESGLADGICRPFVLRTYAADRSYGAAPPHSETRVFDPAMSTDSTQRTSRSADIEVAGAM